MSFDNFEFTADGKGTYIVKRGRKYVRLGGSELKHLFEVLKAKASELPDALLPALESPDLSPELKSQLDQKFEEWGFAGEGTDAPQTERRSQLSRVYLFSFNPSKVLSRIPRFIKALYSLPGIACILAVSVGKYFVFSDRLLTAAQAVLSYSLSLPDVLLILLGLFFSFWLHEMAHALCCSYYGGTIPRMGMLLYFFLPAFFCDVSDIYMIAKRKVSFAVGIAGISSNLLTGSLCCLIYFLTGCTSPIWLYIWFCNVGVAVYNLLPIVKLDGYWVLSSLAGMNNMMEKSTVLFLTALLKHRDIPESISPLKRFLLGLYGLSIFLVRPAVWISSGYEIEQLLLRIGCPSLLATLLFAAVIAVAVYDEAQMLKKQLRLYKNDRARILRMI